MAILGAPSVTVGRLLLILIAATIGIPQSTATTQYGVPASLDDGWKTERAQSLGVDSQRLAALTHSVRAWPELGVHAGMMSGL